MKPAEVARLLSVSRSWVYEAAEDGRLPCVRLGDGGGPVRFVREDVEAWLEGERSLWTPGRR